MSLVREVLELDDMPHFTTIQKTVDRINAWKLRWLLKEKAREGIRVVRPPWMRRDVIAVDHADTIRNVLKTALRRT
jgi:hypothetical protein